MMKRMEQILDFGQKPDLLDNNGPVGGLCLNFRNVPLRTVLNYLCDEADFTIESNPMWKLSARSISGMINL